MKDFLKRMLPLFIVLLVMAVITVPKQISERAAENYGRPLFEHALPANTELVQKDASKTSDGGVMAVLLLKTDLSSEELEAFYSDLDCAPFKEGQTASVSANALDDASLQALEKAAMREEGANYQFVYLYSRAESDPQ